MMVLVNRRKSGAGRLRAPDLLRLFLLPTLMGGHDLTCPVLVRWMIQQSPNVVDEQWVKKLGNLLLVREIEGPLKGNPNALEMHRANLHNVPHFLALENTVSPTSGHSRHIQQLRTINHVVIFSAGDADAASLDLEAKAPFILPECSRYPGLHARRRNLSGRVKAGVLVLHLGWLARHARKRARPGKETGAAHSTGYGRCRRGGRHSIGIAILMTVRRRRRVLAGTWLQKRWLVRIVRHAA